MHKFPRPTRIQYLTTLTVIKASDVERITHCYIRQAIIVFLEVWCQLSMSKLNMLVKFKSKKVKKDEILYTNFLLHHSVIISCPIVLHVASNPFKLNSTKNLLSSANWKFVCVHSRYLWLPMARWSKPNKFRHKKLVL